MEKYKDDTTVERKWNSLEELCQQVLKSREFVLTFLTEEENNKTLV